MARQSRLTYSHTLTPAEAAAEDARSERELRASFVQGTVYGLAAWPGTRAVGGSGRGGDGFGHLELVFDDLDARGGSVSVVTVVAERLTIKIGELRGRAGAVSSRDYEAVAAEPSDEITFLVDDRPVAFRLWRDAGYDVATASLGERGVVLAIRGVPLTEIRLTRVDDLEPLLAGTRALIAKHRDEAQGR